MAFDLASVGTSTAPVSFTYDWKATALYALGIGAKKDELDYLYEGRGPKVYPTFAVVPALPVVFACMQATKGNAAMVVHGAQSVVLHRDIPPEGTLSTVGTIDGLYDMKKFGQAIFRTKSTLPDGELVFETEWSIIFRADGGFGGPPPPKRPEGHAVPKDRPADFRFEETTTPEQALLYRLSGDLNPLHADPAFAADVGFAQGPIFHGLGTFGFAARAIIKTALAGDASKLRRFDAQFRKPVWPGDTLVTEVWNEAGGDLTVVTSVKERNEQVLTNAWAGKRLGKATTMADDKDAKDEKKTAADDADEYPVAAKSKQPETKKSAVDEEEEDDEEEEEDEEDEEEEEEENAPPAPPANEEDPTWWAPHAVLGALLLIGIAGYFGAFSGIAKAGDASSATTDSKPAASAAAAPATVSAQHILVMHKDSPRVPPGITRTKEEAKARAQEALAKIRGGANFDDVARDYTDEPGSNKKVPPGDLGTFKKGQMVPAFDAAVFGMKVGAISDLVETQFGYHIIKRNK